MNIKKADIIYMNFIILLISILFTLTLQNIISKILGLLILIMIIFIPLYYEYKQHKLLIKRLKDKTI